MKTNWVGKKFHKLTIIETLPQRRALCLCDCGGTSIVFLNNISRKNPNTTSCGCEHKKAIHRRFESSHKKSKTRIYSIWTNMKTRCSNKNSDKYRWYGARGIKICDRWESFDNFYNDMGDPPTEKHTLERINNDGNYEKENCRWATMSEQCSNRRKRQG